MKWPIDMHPVRYDYHYARPLYNIYEAFDELVLFL